MTAEEVLATMESVDLQHINTLDSQDPRMILRQIHALRDCGDLREDLVNWRAVAWIASDNARRKLDLAWAEVAAAAYDVLSSDELRQGQQYNYEVDAMMLKVFLIDRLGERQDHPFLDASLVVQWFLSTMSMSPPEVMSLAARIQTVPTSTEEYRTTLLELRQIKNRLKVIESIKRTDAVRSSAEVQEWCKLSHLLP